MTQGCRIWARWDAGLLPPNAWRALSPRNAFDRETTEALYAARYRRVPLVLDAAGVEFASEVPLLMGHQRPAAGVFTSFWHDGKTCTATGWADPKHYGELLGLPHLSPGLRILAARLEAMGGLRLARMTRVKVLDLSAVARPLLAGTVFYVLKPEPMPAGERFDAAEELTHGR